MPGLQVTAMLLACGCTGRLASAPGDDVLRTQAAPAASATAPEPGNSGAVKAAAPIPPQVEDAGPPEPPPQCRLPTTVTLPSSYLVTTLALGRRSVAEWHVAKDGSISWFPSELDPDNKAAAEGATVVLGPAASNAASSTPGPRARPAPAPPSSEVRYLLSGPSQHCSVAPPGRRPHDVDLQWYDFHDDYHRFAVLWPRSGEQPVILVHQHLLSPGLGWFASSVGDLDGDGRSDLAFVAEGVGTCGGDTPPSCALLWIEVLMTSTHTSLPPLDLVQIGNASVLAGEIGTEEFGTPSQWRGRIRPRAFEVSVSGPKGRHTWTAVLEAGVLRLQNTLP